MTNEKTCVVCGAKSIAFTAISNTATHTVCDICHKVLHNDDPTGLGTLTPNRNALAAAHRSEYSTCINCGVELNVADEDPNGDKNPDCAKCRAEERHDFDREPWALFDRYGERIEMCGDCRHLRTNGRCRSNFTPREADGNCDQFDSLGANEALATLSSAAEQMEESSPICRSDCAHFDSSRNFCVAPDRYLEHNNGTSCRGFVLKREAFYNTDTPNKTVNEPKPRKPRKKAVPTETPKPIRVLPDSEILKAINTPDQSDGESNESEYRP